MDIEIEQKNKEKFGEKNRITRSKVMEETKHV